MRACTAFALVLACSLGATAGHAGERAGPADRAAKGLQTFSISATDNQSDPRFRDRTKQFVAKQLIDKGYRHAAAGSVPDIVVKLDYSAKRLSLRSNSPVALAAPTDLPYWTSLPFAQSTAETTASLAYATLSANRPRAVAGLYQVKVAIDVSRADGALLLGDRREVQRVSRARPDGSDLIAAMLKDLPAAD